MAVRSAVRPEASECKLGMVGSYRLLATISIRLHRRFRTIVVVAVQFR